MNFTYGCDGLGDKLVSDTGMYVIRPVIINNFDVDPAEFTEFDVFGLYRRNEDGTSTHLGDYDTVSEAVQAAVCENDN